MKKSVVIALLIFHVLSLPIAAQTFTKSCLKPEQKGELWGYRDSCTGTLAIDYKYTDALPFNEGMAIVYLDDKLTGIDHVGKELVPADHYDDLYRQGNFIYASKTIADISKMAVWNDRGKLLIPFNYALIREVNGFFLVRTAEDQQGLIDTSGKILMKATCSNFMWCGDYNLAYRQDKIALLNSAGKQITDFIYDAVGEFQNGAAIIKTNGQCGTIDYFGNSLIPAIYDTLIYYTAYRFYQCRKGVKTDIIDMMGNKVVLPHPGDLEFDFRFETYVAYEGESIKWGCSIPDGDIITLAIYDNISYYESEGLIKVEKSGKRGLIDFSGNEVLPCIFDEISDMTNGLVGVRKGKKWGYYDRSGKEIIPVQFDDISSFSNGMALVTKKGKRGLINLRGTFIIPLSDVSIFYSNSENLQNNALFIVEEKDKKYMTDRYGRKITGLYEDIDKDYTNFSENAEYFIVTDHSKKGLIAFTEIFKKFTILPVVYDEIVLNWHIYAKRDGLWGIYDRMGLELIPLLYDSLEPLYNPSWYNEHLAKKNGKWGLIHLNGDVILDFIYDEIKILTYPAPDLLLVKDGLCGVRFSDGRTLETDYEFIEYVDSNLVIFKSVGKWGVIDADKKVIIPAKYDTLINVNHVFLGAKEGKSMILNREGKELFYFDHMVEFSDPEHTDTTYFIINTGGLMTEKKFLKNIEFFVMMDPETGMENGESAVFDYRLWRYFIGGKAKIITSDGVWIGEEYDRIKLPVEVSYIYDPNQKVMPEYADLFEDYPFKEADSNGTTTSYYSLSNFDQSETTYPVLVSKNNRWGAISFEGKTIIPVLYKSIQAVKEHDDLVYLASDGPLIFKYDKEGKLLSRFSYDTALSICNNNKHIRYLPSTYLLDDVDSTMIRNMMKRLIQLALEGKISVYRDEQLTTPFTLTPEVKLRDTCSGQFSAAPIDYTHKITWMDVFNKYISDEERFRYPKSSIFSFAPYALLPGECVWNDEGTVQAIYADNPFFYFSSDEIWVLLKGDKEIQKFYKWIYEENNEFLKTPMIIETYGSDDFNYESFVYYLADRFGNYLTDQYFASLTEKQNYPDLFDFTKYNNETWTTTYGLITSKGKIYYPINPDEAVDFSNGYAIVRPDDPNITDPKFGIIDSTGNEIMPFKYDSIVFLSGIYAMLDDHLWQLVKISHSDYTLVSNDYYEQVSNRNNYPHNEDELMFETYSYIAEGIIKIKKDGYWGLMSNQGELILPCEYDAIEFVTYGWQLVKGKIEEEADQWKEWDYANKYYEKMPGITRGFALTNGKLVLPAIADFYHFTGTGILAHANEKYSLIDSTGKTIIPFVIDTFYNVFVDEGNELPITVIEIQGKKEIFDRNWRSLSSYDSIVFRSNYCKLMKDQKWGVLWYLSGVMIPCVYDHIDVFDGRAFEVTINKDYFLINASGKRIEGDGECTFFNAARVIAFQSEKEIKTAPVTIVNDLDYFVEIHLYHSENPDEIWNSWTFEPFSKGTLELDNDIFAVGNDWGISITTDAVFDHCSVFIRDASVLKNDEFVVKTSELVKY